MITAEPISSIFIVSALFSANGLQLFTHDDDESDGTRDWNWLQLDMIMTQQHSILSGISTNDNLGFLSGHRFTLYEKGQPSQRFKDCIS